MHNDANCWLENQILRKAKQVFFVTVHCGAEQSGEELYAKVEQEKAARVLHAAQRVGARHTGAHEESKDGLDRQRENHAQEGDQEVRADEFAQPFKGHCKDQRGRDEPDQDRREEERTRPGPDEEARKRGE